jgi:hypothetical protein
LEKLDEKVAKEAQEKRAAEDAIKEAEDKRQLELEAEKAA